VGKQGPNWRSWCGFSPELNDHADSPAFGNVEGIDASSLEINDICNVPYTNFVVFDSAAVALVLSWPPRR
jgi:hypothetical protein